MATEIPVTVAIATTATVDAATAVPAVTVAAVVAVDELVVTTVPAPWLGTLLI